MSSLQPALLPQLSTIPTSAKEGSLYSPTTISSLSESDLPFEAPSAGGSDGSHSPPSSPETDSHPSRSHSPPTQLDADTLAEQDELADEVASAPLPSCVIRPKGIAERERERAFGLANGGAKKKANSMVAQMQRKRADSLKWSKYKNMGSGVIELNLCQDELRRVN